MSTDPGTPTVTLTLGVPPVWSLDEVLIGTITLTNTGQDPVMVSSRLTLAEGDLAVEVTGPDGRTRAAGWPWPADSGLREVTLPGGHALECGVLLLCTRSSQPLFPGVGEYVFTARFSIDAQTMLDAPAVRAVAEPASDDPARARARDLTDRDVIQSLAASGELGAAGPALSRLSGSPHPSTALAADLARGIAPASTDRMDPVELAAVMTAVLPPPTLDPRATAAMDHLIAGARLPGNAQARAAAMLAGLPHLQA